MTRSRVVGAVLLAGALAVGVTPAYAEDAPSDTSAAGSSGASDAATATGSQLHLVTLTGPGLAGSGGSSAPDRRRQLEADQSRLLARVDAPEPVYRWTDALNGFAVELDAEQARALASDPAVAMVEENSVRPLASTPAAASSPVTRPGGRGGAGTVIGFVDSGIDPQQRAFADVTDPGATPRFRGECTDTSDDPTWPTSACGQKIAAAQYFVAGFGADRVRAEESLSPRDVDGHGSQVASIAAGNPRVPVRIDGESLGRQSGAAPRARVAAYKACWTAPDPDQDGCATADLVAAIDQATADRVDVLNLAVGGPDRIDTVERALLGAAESGAVVVGAAGNEGDDAYAAHPAPWVVSVGATTGAVRAGVVEAGPHGLRGRMSSPSSVRNAPLVLGTDVAAPGASNRAARRCQPGSLDAGGTAGAVVVCERGGSARVAKSDAVERADGVGMILVNPGPGSVNADLHAVPTVHLDAADGRTLTSWARTTERPRVDLLARGTVDREPEVAEFSSAGDPRWSLLKPDVVAPGTEILAAAPDGWELITGTSAAAARVSGTAARMLSKPGSEAREVRSALLTTAHGLSGSGVNQAGAGRVGTAVPPLAYLVPERHYRAWLEGDRALPNQPSALLDRDETQVQRTVTNTSDRTLSVRATTEGFTAPARVFPAAAELAPGEDLTFRVTLPRAGNGDRGTVTWRTGRGERAALTVVTTR